MAKKAYILESECVSLVFYLYLWAWEHMISQVLRPLGQAGVRNIWTTRPGWRQEHLLHSCMIGIFVTDKTKALCQRLFTLVYCLVLLLKVWCTPTKGTLEGKLTFLPCWSLHAYGNGEFSLCCQTLFFLCCLFRWVLDWNQSKSDFRRASSCAGAPSETVCVWKNWRLPEAEQEHRLPGWSGNQQRYGSWSHYCTIQKMTHFFWIIAMALPATHESQWFLWIS